MASYSPSVRMIVVQSLGTVCRPNRPHPPPGGSRRCQDLRSRARALIRRVMNGPVGASLLLLQPLYHPWSLMHRPYQPLHLFHRCCRARPKEVSDPCDPLSRCTLKTARTLSKIRTPTLKNFSLHLFIYKTHLLFYSRASQSTRDSYYFVCTRTSFFYCGGRDSNHGRKA